MKAPTQKVASKLLSAHKQRSLRMIMQFKQQLLLCTNTTTSTDSNDKVGMILTISTAREFHQSLMVGLIESCKGLIELYSVQPDSSNSTTTTTATTTTTTTSSTSTDEIMHSYKSLESMIATIMSDYTKTILQAFEFFFKRYNYSSSFYCYCIYTSYTINIHILYTIHAYTIYYTIHAYTIYTIHYTIY